MDGQPAAVHIIGFLTQQVEQLGVAHGDQEVEAVIRVRHDEEQGGLLVSQGIQLQLIVGGHFPQLRNIEYGKPRAAAHEYGFRCFAGG